jgi:hypothetical protein
LQSADILQTIAEVSIAFAGFTSVVAVLGRRATGDWAEIDRFRLSQMLSSSLATLLLSLLPLILAHLHLSERATWGWASVVLAMYLIFAAVSGPRRIRGLPSQERPQIIRPLAGAMVVVAGAIVAFLVLNVAGIFFQREPGPYLLGLYFLLAFSAFQFTRLLLVIRPGRGAGKGGA